MLQRFMNRSEIQPDLTGSKRGSPAAATLMAAATGSYRRYRMGSTGSKSYQCMAARPAATVRSHP